MVPFWRQKLRKRTRKTPLMLGNFTGLIHFTGMVMLSLSSSEGMDSGQDTINLRGTAAVHAMNRIYVRGVWIAIPIN